VAQPRDPYAREWQNGCGRWDLLDVVRTAHALRPEGIEWPKGDDGRTSFKLERSARQRPAHEAAHDALSDVRATIALARLIRLRPEAIRARLFVANDALPAGVTRLPIKTLHANKSPFVCANLQTLKPERAAALGLDLALALRHAEQLHTQGGRLDGLWAEVFLPPEPQRLSADADLYGGFVPEADRRLLTQLRQLEPARLAERVQAGRVAFADPRLDELLWLYRARNHPEALSQAERARWEQERAERLHVSGRVTLAAYLERLDALHEQLGEDERAGDLLGALMDWAEHIAPPLPLSGFAAG
jgi:exodeoxyribonuclease-1